MATTRTFFVCQLRLRFTEYKLQPTDKNKSLRQIAKEKLGEELLVKLIYKKREGANPNPVWEAIPNEDRYDPNMTLLLPPPTEFASFTLTATVNVRTDAKADGNILYMAEANKRFIYHKKSVKVIGAQVWANISPTDPKRNNEAPYWVCVKDGMVTFTNPSVNGPS